MSAEKSKLDHQAVIGVGSNIFPRDNIRSSLYLLSRMVTIEAVSSIWKTSAIGSPGPDFLNAALLILSHFSFDELRNEILRPIETLLGRVRTQDPNSPRTIDLDILIFDGIIRDDQLWEYAHMGVPVAEIIPDYVDPHTGVQAIVIAERLRNSSGIVEARLNLHWRSATRDIV